MGATTILASLLSPEPMRAALTFLALGAAFHQFIRVGEIDNRLRPLSAFYLGGFLALCTGYVHLFSLSWPRALAAAILASLFFNCGLTASIVLYRFFFHRLRRFPGPWTAKVARLFAVAQATERTQYHLDLETMHRKYGDFVRTGPRELSINRPSAVNILGGAQSLCTKPTWYSHVSDDNTQISLNSTRDPDVHRRRRRAWDRGFSMKGNKFQLTALQLFVFRLILVAQPCPYMSPVFSTKWTSLFRRSDPVSKNL